MPKYTVQAPDGRSYDIEGDGTPEQAVAAFQQMFPGTQTPPPADGGPVTTAQPDVTMAERAQHPLDNQMAGADTTKDTMDSIGKWVTGGAETLGTLATGAIAAPIAGIAGAGQGLINIGARALGMKEPQEAADVVGGVQNALTYHPQTDEGQKIEKYAMKPFELLDKGTDAAGEAGRNAVGPDHPEAGAITGTAIKTGLNAIPMALGNLLKPGELAQAAERAPEPAARPTAEQMSPDEAHAAHVETLLSHDVPLSTGQRGIGFGAKQAASAQRGADTILGPSQLQEQQGMKYTGAALRTLDHEETTAGAERATPDVMDRVQRGISDEYDDLLGRHDVEIRQPHVEQLVELRDRVRGTLDANEASPLLHRIQSIMDHVEADQPTATLSARFVQNARSSLGQMANGAKNGAVKNLAGDLQDVLDDAWSDSATPAEVQQMNALRRRVQKVKQITPAINENGIISPTKLYSELNKKQNTTQMKLGRGDQRLVQLAKAGKAVLPEKLGNSGTAARASDVMKAIQIVRNPVRAVKEGAVLASGRLLERNADRGTLSRVREQNAPPRPTPYLDALGVASAAESPEQRRLRMQAEMLRNLGAN